MLKHIGDKPKEPARELAKRKWSNHNIEKRYKESREQYAPDDPENPFKTEYGKKQKPTAPSALNVISRAKPDRRGSVIRSQTMFAKFIREMLDDHKRKNAQKQLILYAISIKLQRYRLLKEKLRRLEIREADRVARQNQEQSNV
jgi:hypothetical protein